MLFRNCAGGVVFLENKVLLLKNEKDEWVLPKGIIRNDDLSKDIAISRVKKETNIEAEVISSIGETCYEFFSVTRQKPVCNEIVWYLMRALDDDCKLNEALDFKKVGFFELSEAMNMITYSQDKSLVYLSYKKYKDLVLSEMMV